MPARLFCPTGQLAGLSFSFADEATIGRRDDNHLSLPAKVVSSHHARIFLDAETTSYVLEDLGSRNGTAIDGMPVTEPVPLDHHLHVITFANEFEFIFVTPRPGDVRRPAPQAPQKRPEPVVRDGAAARQDAPDARAQTRVGDPFAAAPDVPSRQPAAPDAKAQTRVGDPFAAVPNEPSRQPAAPDARSQTRVGDPFDAAPQLSSRADAKPDPLHQTRMGDAFEMPPPSALQPPDKPSSSVPQAPPARTLTIRDKNATRSISLKEGRFSVGRTSAADIVIDDSSISRKHAVLTVYPDRITVRDTGSKNGTYLNGRRVSGEVVLAAGAVIRFGNEIEAEWSAGGHR